MHKEEQMDQTSGLSQNFTQGCISISSSIHMIGEACLESKIGTCRVVGRPFEVKTRKNCRVDQDQMPRIINNKMSLHIISKSFLVSVTNSNISAAIPIKVNKIWDN